MKSHTLYYSVSILRRENKTAKDKPNWFLLVTIANFWTSRYKNSTEAKRAAGRLAVGLYKGECRVFVVTDYFRGKIYCHRMEEVTETEEGIL